MERLRFETEAAVVPAAPNRADIALFVGFVDRRATAVPASIADWLCERRWLTSAERVAARGGDVLPLDDVPVPIDTWDVFDHLFAWDRRRITGTDETATSYLGAAVRSFFFQGGRKCYVVRAGGTWPLLESGPDAGARASQRLQQLIPGFEGSAASPAAGEPTSWHGLGHLNGLPDVSILCLPDLADILSAPQSPLPVDRPPKPRPVEWSECSAPEPAVVPDRTARFLPAPRCDDYARWATTVNGAANFVARYAREVQLVAAIPLPLTKEDAVRDAIAHLDAAAREGDANEPGQPPAFLQLAYPWVRTAGSTQLPEQLESPDGVLAGVLARNALTRGAFRTIAGLDLGDVYDALPVLSDAERQRLLPTTRRPSDRARSVVERVSLLGPTPDGWQVLSDVTTSRNGNDRPAPLRRLCALLVREARQLGEQLLFESNSERLWARLREHFRKVLAGLLQAGALRGARPEDAFDVRCDRSTMTQNDIDNGRIVAQIHVDGAPPIEQITVVLAMDEGGSVSLAASGRREQDAA